ncbi:unnamed protein product [Rotaria sp. Silwood1]|nr:unnamed protein product [Rotaria sp. Silwood1]CAF3362184.1 unnamed protein product [Rotaria sp. Silwood1]CAF3396256.1 unnamed protein product [Rotaria sp. Silwood1]CAF4608405.1 unnamed protein product [Rotaria sp. Silwood1]CAF4819969.1 unnamed protein product [Rotaria sp. Silwood1]
MNFGHLFGKKSKSKSSKNSNDNEKFETNVKNSTQIQEKIPAREAIHSDGVLNVYPVDTSTILSGSQDRTLVLYDFINHRIRRRWTGHENDVVKVLYGHIVNLVVSASRDRTIHFWNINSDLPVQKLLGHELVVTAIDFNPENSVLISGSRDNKIIFWDTKTGQILKKIMIGRNLITDAKWSHDGTFIAQTGEDKETKMYDARNMTQVVSFPKKQYIQTSCDISNDDRYLVSVTNGFNGSGAEISLWDIRQRKLLSEFYGHRATVNSGHFVDPTASMIISCSNDGRAILWNVQQTSIFAELDVDNATPLTSIIAVNTQNFATGGLNGKVSFVQRLNRQLQLTDQI